MNNVLRLVPRKRTNAGDMIYDLEQELNETRKRERAARALIERYVEAAEGLEDAKDELEEAADALANEVKKWKWEKEKRNDPCN